MDTIFPLYNIMRYVLDVYVVVGKEDIVREVLCSLMMN